VSQTGDDSMLEHQSVCIVCSRAIYFELNKHTYETTRSNGNVIVWELERETDRERERIVYRLSRQKYIALQKVYLVYLVPLAGLHGQITPTA